MNDINQYVYEGERKRERDFEYEERLNFIKSASYTSVIIAQNS